MNSKVKSFVAALVIEPSEAVVGKVTVAFLLALSTATSQPSATSSAAAGTPSVVTTFVT